jgi:hypothetical protein
MTRVTIVNFMAYDKPRTEVFYKKSFEEINEHLTDICSTYEPTKIEVCDLITFEPLSTLKNLRDAN